MGTGTKLLSIIGGFGLGLITPEEEEEEEEEEEGGRYGNDSGGGERYGELEGRRGSGGGMDENKKNRTHRESGFYG